MRTLSFLLAACLAAQLAGTAGAHDGGHEVTGPAEGYVYRLAEPGTYVLPAIKPAADARLLDDSGAQRRLSALLRGRVTVLAFLYTRCADLCPLASLRLADLQLLASRRPELSERLQLISLSFDPEHDTPARMAELARQWRDPDVPAPPWLFLTGPSRQTIAPVLEAYGQPVAAKADPDDPAGPLSHLLRVFLIDRQGMIRNIYSADFLDPRLVLNDVVTLLLSERQE